MNEIIEKYLAKMLEGAEQGLSQVEMALQQMEEQQRGLDAQRGEVIIAIKELKDLLGLEEEEEEEEEEEDAEN